MRERNKRAMVLVGLAALSLFNSIARADFLLVSQNLALNSQTANFTLTFNQAPDFYTLDSQGRPADSFQVNFAGVYPTPGLSFPKNLTAVIRGDEIHFANNLPIRATSGNGGPNAAGWGPVIDSVPFSQNGDSVAFSVPTADLGYGGHNAQYRVFSLQFGRQTSSETVTLVPTPTALESGLAGLVIVALLTAYISRHNRHHYSD